MASVGTYFLRLASNWSRLRGSLRATWPYFKGAADRTREATEEYPDRVSARMPEDLPPRWRGLLDNDIDVCSGCRYCADVCPVNCIRIETEPGPERNASWVAVFDIDHSKCMFCGLCSEICPTGSLKHTREYQSSTYERLDLVSAFGRGWATKEMKDRWRRDQVASDARLEELAQYEKSPVGAELRRRREKKETE